VSNLSECFAEDDGFLAWVSWFPEQCGAPVTGSCWGAAGIRDLPRTGVGIGVASARRLDNRR
jgi:hypothetical protein